MGVGCVCPKAKPSTIKGSLVKLKIHLAKKKLLSYYCDSDRFSCSDIDLVKHSAVASIFLFFLPLLAQKPSWGLAGRWWLGEEGG